MAAKYRFYILIAILASAGIFLTIYKNRVLHFPLFTDKTIPVWTVESHITFEPTSKDVEVSLAIPGNQSNLAIARETQLSGKEYQFNIVENVPHKEHRRAIWKASGVDGKQDILYRTSVYDVSQRRLEFYKADIPDVPVELSEEQLVAVKEIVKNINVDPKKDKIAFIDALLDVISEKELQPQAVLLLGSKPTKDKRLKLAQTILATLDIKSVLAKGFELDKSKKKQKLTSVLCVGNESKWSFFIFGTDSHKLPPRFLFWQRGGNSLLDVTGGKDVKIRISVLKENRSAGAFAVDTASNHKSMLVNFSIYSLPISQQSTFKKLLMVPLGALIVVLLRNLVGIATSGTFMPILIAMAFLETNVLPGIVIFLLIVSSGLAVRSYLTRLNLLLIPRISAVLIVVVFIMAFLSVLSYKLGVRQGLTITFFPMIVLSWTVERLCVLWEEQGPKDVFVRGGGSLIVAVIAYFVMSNGTARHMMFAFPELMLVVLAIILLLGRYSGYRLSELIRFKAFDQGGNDNA